MLFNIGQCEAAAKRYGLALEAFEGYLIKGGDDVPEEKRVFVDGEVKRLQGMVGAIEVEASDGAEISVDGMVRAKTPLVGPLRVEAGAHVVVLSKDGVKLSKTSENRHGDDYENRGGGEAGHGGASDISARGAR